MMHRRHIVVDGRSVTLYSTDGKTWFMKPADSMKHHRNRAKMRESIRQSFLRSCFDLEDIDPIPVDETLNTSRPRR